MDLENTGRKKDNHDSGFPCKSPNQSNNDRRNNDRKFADCSDGGRRARALHLRDGADERRPQGDGREQAEGRARVHDEKQVLRDSGGSRGDRAHPELLRDKRHDRGIRQRRTAVAGAGDRRNIRRQHRNDHHGTDRFAETGQPRTSGHHDRRGRTTSRPRQVDARDSAHGAGIRLPLLRHAGHEP